MTFFPFESLPATWVITLLTHLFPKLHPSVHYPKLYHPFGFQAAINYQIECPFNVPEDFFMVKPLSGYEDKYQGKVIYPPGVHNV